MNIGHASAVAAFLMWGLLPLYWKQLQAVPSLQLVAHRVIWSTLTLVPLLWWRGGAERIGPVLGSPRLLARQALAAVLVAANWLGFVWAVTHGRMIESSLGYFLTPLVSVLLGVAILGERLRPLQWVAVSIAVLGVARIASGYHHVPWIALFLAGTFSAYALVKKTGDLPALPSMTLETAILFLPALAYLAVEHAGRRGSFGTISPGTDLLIAAAGPATAAPLLCFTVAAKRIPLSTLGLLQYIGPTLQFALGWGIYREPFDPRRFSGFLIVWTALLVFVVDGLMREAAAGSPRIRGPRSAGNGDRPGKPRP